MQNVNDWTGFLNRALQLHDNESGLHCGRVSCLSESLGLACGMPSRQIRRLALAAQLHDVGKIDTPAAILRKTGPLSPAEWERIKEHPVIGERIVAGVFPHDGLLLAAIRHHHERWDGAGYPDQLAGTAIPLLARIIAVADAFDAMTNARSYRKRPMRQVDAIQQIRSLAGSQFDPAVTLAFVALMMPSTKKTARIRKEILA